MIFHIGLLKIFQHTWLVPYHFSRRVHIFQHLQAAAFRWRDGEEVSRHYKFCFRQAAPPSPWQSPATR
jgi:hypothetical protein